MALMMTPALRKFALTTHVTSSVGWLGAVAGFLALAVAGVTIQDPQTVRAAYLSMHLITWFVIVPFSLAGFLTGLVQSLGTPWGLFRHYWVVTKLLLTTLATIILLVHTQPIDRVAAVAAVTTLSTSDLWQVRLQLVGDASAALFVLFVTTTLSVYKPWGMTAYGLRKQEETMSAWRPATSRRAAPAGRYVLFGIIGFVLLLILIHLAGGGLHGH
ncbi:MAG TPA: hypothetical protein VEL51_22130 [Vicinamibacterales bacterium]|nr:hypothetical protein [Vicinamibacterales bacterium]